MPLRLVVFARVSIIKFSSSGLKGLISFPAFKEIVIIRLNRIKIILQNPVNDFLKVKDVVVFNLFIFDGDNITCYEILNIPKL